MYWQIRKGRTGDDLKVVTSYGLEDLFMKYGVDVNQFIVLYVANYKYTNFYINSNRSNSMAINMYMRGLIQSMIIIFTTVQKLRFTSMLKHRFK